VIGSLELGGAERSLCALIKHLGDVADMSVVTLIPGGALEGDVCQLGTPLSTLGMQPGRPNPRAVLALAQQLRAMRPDVVVTWMYHANLIGGLAAKLAGGIPVVWNIRHTLLDPSRHKRLTRWSAQAGGWLSSRVPAAVVYVAHAAQKHHQANGFGCSRSLVIPNGFDVEQFAPDAAARGELRSELGLAGDCELIGMIGRFHPDKDHRTFMMAAAQAAAERSGVHFVLCGEGIDNNNAQLGEYVRHFDLAGRVHLLGTRPEIARVTAALDVAVNSSLNEAFPRSVGEAMACGVPCVVTDVGDSARLVANTGRVVPPGDPRQLTRALLDLLDLGPEARQQLGAKARARIANRFDVDRLAWRHLSLWQSVARTRPSVVTPPHSAWSAARLPRLGSRLSTR
jgi:glycosyltransferase involved in cell wall biosynthesis